MKEILIIFLCVPFFVINSFCDKYASTSGKASANIRYNACKFIIGSIILFPLSVLGKAPIFQKGTLVCGLACGLMYAVNKTAVLKGYEITSVSYMTLCHAAGMLAPCILGHFLWEEQITPISLAGILLTVTSIVAMKNTEKTKNLNIPGLLIGFAVFASSGGVMILQKVMGIYFENENISAYNFYSFFVPAVIMTLCLAPAKKETDGQASHNKIVLPALGSAVSLCIISLVMTKLAGKVPSAVMFPLFNGTGIIAVCIGAVFVFKEKMTLKQIIAMCTSVIGMCLASV